jgi:hypothetical protein
MKLLVVRLPGICALALTLALAAIGTQTMRAQVAAGQPIFDCSNAQARVAQLNSGLPVMEDALKRSEARMNSLQNELKLGKEEAQKQETELAQEQMKEAASEALDEVVPLRARLKALQAAGISPSTTGDFIRQMNAINEQLDQIETLSKLLTSFKAGMAYGQQIQSSAHSLGEHISMLNTMLTNSGFYNQAGNALAGSLLGPVGPVLFNRVLSLIDTSLQSEANFDLVVQEQQEADTENTLRRSVDNIHDQIQELQTNCLNQTSSSSVPNSPPPVPPPASPPPPSSAASNSHAGAILLVGTLAVGGVAAYAAGSMMNGSGSCGSAPENPYYACPGSGCSSATTAYSNWCKCEGYAGGLDVNSGACVH